ncbi:uncharacterized protein LOC135399806 [Ornithodoros turicata]|uniref:uncharacterized protein LOC135399806 n=1 Tax=Ornithodoros turicata TaxID=34597 RepID=UPI00313977DF
MASFNEKLVQEVKKHKQLWDQHSKLHKEASFREAAWTQIAESLAVTVEECQTRWRTIRDTYLKRKKRQRNGVNKGQWNVLDRELSFLDDFLRPRTRLARVRALKANVKMEAEDPQSDEGSAESIYGSVVATQDVQQEMQSVEKQLLVDGRSACDSTTVDYAVMEYLREFQRTDPEELFCLSLAPHLKRLSPKERTMAKMQMLRTLHEFEFGDAESTEEIID